MRYEQGHKERTRELLLQETAKAIRRDGPERFGVAAVMRQAGLTHGGFYAHFASKDELIAETVTYMFDARYTAFVSSVGSAEPREALAWLVDFYLSLDHCTRAEGTCPIPTLAGEQHRLPEAARERLVRGVEAFTKLVEKLIARAGLASSPKIASSVVSEMVGAVALARLHGRDGKAANVLSAAKRSVKEKLRLV